MALKIRSCPYHNYETVTITFIGTINASCDICTLLDKQGLVFLQACLIHCDVWDPYRHATHGICTYFLTLIDDHSRCTWIFLFASKSQITSLLHNFLILVKAQFNQYAKVLRSDNGTEFIKLALTQILDSLGILHQASCPHTHQMIW